MKTSMSHIYQHSQPIALRPSTEAQTYGLFAVAMGLTVVGVIAGMSIASFLLGSGIHFVFLFAELGIIFSARWWIERSPLNYVLFGLFPLLSGLTITPYILMILTGYANGASILLNALASTTFMAAAAAVFARTTSWDLSVMGRVLFFSLLGLIAFGLLQLFVPALRGTQMELMISGAGILIFAGFTAYDLQRIQSMGRAGANPFMLALSLYLDIFNLFLMILRFMLALSGNRR